MQAAARTAEDLAGPLSGAPAPLTRSVEAYCTENRIASPMASGTSRRSPMAEHRESVVIALDESTAIGSMSSKRVKTDVVDQHLRWQCGVADRSTQGAANCKVH